MATQPEYPDIEENCTQGCGSPSIDPQYIADRERDIRMCCVRAAIDLNRPGESTAASIVAEAQHILDFINGSAQ